jgi:curved DNA-binding protein CbpA
LQVKDYYSILELEPSATGEEIKKAYRRLAHTYHPDKKQENLCAAAKFGEIKEAYEVLSNPLKKDYYLQQRWYAQSMGKKIKQERVTPVSVLKQMLVLDRYVSRLDVHRMYHQGLYEHIISILSDENIAVINAFNEPAINKEIILSTFKSSRPLPYQYIQLLSERLMKLTTNDTQITARIEQFKRQHKQADAWEKRKVWVILFVVLCLCLVIFLSSR